MNVVYTVMLLVLVEKNGVQVDTKYIYVYMYEVCSKSKCTDFPMYELVM